MRAARIMRSAYIGRILAPEERSILAAELAGRLPGAVDRQCHFLDAVEEAIDLYPKLSLPAAEERERREVKLTRLASAGHAFAKAAADLEVDGRSLMAQWQWSVLGRPSQVPRWGQTADAAKWAEVTANAAERGIADMRRAGRPGPRTNRAVFTLVSDIARSYAAAFCEQPSAARNGIFSEVLTLIWRHCDVRDPDHPSRLIQIGGSRLGTVLGGNWLPGEPLKRGRKPKITRNPP
jgi:hypothetical protein